MWPLLGRKVMEFALLSPIAYIVGIFSSRKSSVIIYFQQKDSKAYRLGRGSARGRQGYAQAEYIPLGRGRNAYGRAVYAKTLSAIEIKNTTH